MVTKCLKFEIGSGPISIGFLSMRSFLKETERDLKVVTFHPVKLPGRIFTKTVHDMSKD
jgi:hypothetical protein